MIDLLVVLQNAWRGNGKEYTPEEWLPKLWASHTGKRLRKMIPEGNYVVAVTNASPKVGMTAAAAFPPDLIHLRAIITEFQPRVILGCGRLAQHGLECLDVTHVQAPHPAWRRLTNERVAEVRTVLEELLNGTGMC